MALATFSEEPPGIFSAPTPPVAAGSGSASGSSSGASTGASTGASSGASSGSPDPDIEARASLLADELASLVGDLDPDLLMGAGATAAYGHFARAERLVLAAKTVLAPRIAASGHWRTEGYRSPAALLAAVEGVSDGQAKRTLETGQRLTLLPSTEQALRAGTLSGPKVAEITQAAFVDPESESALLEGSESQPLHVIKERCAQVRATSTRRDPLAAHRRIHAKRSFAWWTDPEGAFCFQGRDTSDRGAELVAHFTPVVNRLRKDKRAAAKAAADALPKGSPTPENEPEAALRADAFYLLVTGRSPTGPPGSSGSSGLAGSPGTPDSPDAGSSRADVADSIDSGTIDSGTIDSDVGPTRLVDQAPRATIIVRVDLEALRRGTVQRGELCEIAGQGPVPVEVVRHLLDDSYLNMVFSEAGDIKAVSHQGRTINQRLRTALAIRDRHCVVPGCGVAYWLEIDHIISMERGGLTCLDNLTVP